MVVSQPLLYLVGHEVDQEGPAAAPQDRRRHQRAHQRQVSSAQIISSEHQQALHHKGKGDPHLPQGVQEVDRRQRERGPQINSPHDVDKTRHGANWSNAVAALPEIVETLQAKGYTFVAVPELLHVKPYLLRRKGGFVSNVILREAAKGGRLKNLSRERF